MPPSTSAVTNDLQKEATLSHIDSVLHACIHCGMCLPVCPTYAMTYREESSPRGRIRLMREMFTGKLDLSNAFVDEMYFCLDCQACQTACPAGVQYGTLVEDARRMIAERAMEPLSLRITKKLLLKGILASPFRTKFAATLLRLYGKSGLQRGVDRSKLLNIFSPSLRKKHEMLPTVAEKSFDSLTPEVVDNVGDKKGRVALLTGCIMNVCFPEIHNDVVEVLAWNGYEVVIPARQVCCGSLHAHYGELPDAVGLAKKNIDAFDAEGFDAVIVDSAGCGAFLKEYGHLLRDDPVYGKRAEHFSKKVKDIMEFLVEIDFRPPEGRCEQRVTYHEACHLVHTQGISRQPREIIERIPGVEFQELPESTWCCGSAGIYNVVRFDDSMQLLDRKMNNVASTGADIVLTANPGCHLQLRYGIKRFGLNMTVMHPVSLLNCAYREGA